MDIHTMATKINPATELAPAENKKKVLVPVANGTEEMEAVIVINVLRRAGATVTVASVEEGMQIAASRGVNIVADCLISECEEQEYDLVALPGGMPGAERLRDSKALKSIAEKQVKAKRMIAAICAAPVVALQAWGLLKGLHATCHPSFTGKLEDKAAVESRIVRDSILTTSRAPGTAFEFALALVEQLYGPENLPTVSGPMVLPPDDGTDARALKFNDQEWSTSSTPQVLVPIVNGSEETEVVIIVDILRRAGAKVVVASVESEATIKAARNVQLVADTLISEVANTKFDLVVLPGGMPGADRLQKSKELMRILQEQAEEGRIYGAICAAPAVILESSGLLHGKKATCHPTFSSKLKDQTAMEGRVVIDGPVITSRGPGTAMEFTLNIVEKLYSRVKAQEIAEAMLFDYL
ncbi:protein DJ-1 homolog A isoform X1 [Physcomitrium patens]|uniref:DJ-1/PfpI domain-containing protein n=1 Tax=Physcomitrium patens TaxID=3218 RepID=A0A7I3ZVH9_PHYPA|nr:protein DJ-1 homolog A-like isoform X1 [Physcomitrium patens]|eukprot:XP_024383402.1 protein DJ-1 homolog A-like isoform X1 [Physcomitrella patens]